MLLIGRQTARTCQTLSRRAFLQVGASSVLGLSLADLLKLRAHGAELGSAKSVVLLWLWGRAPDERVTRSGDGDAIRLLRSRLVLATQ